MKLYPGIIECCKCGATIPVPEHEPAGLTARENGYVYITSWTNQSLYVCPTCKPALFSAVKTLMEITGDEYIFLGSIVKQMETE